MKASVTTTILRIYLALFLAYLFLPLLTMMLATFNESKFPTVTPWLGTTTKWFGELAADGRMWTSLRSTFIVAIAVIVISVPVGTGAALLVTGLHGRVRSIAYGVMISPLLMPGVIIGISTLVFWKRLDVAGGLPLIVLAQSSYITAYVMLMVMARLQRFDLTLDEAALDLGATHLQSFRRILLPHLRPAILSACVLAFLQSFENFNVTLFTRGNEETLTVYIASKVRTGLSPAVNALAMIMILATIAGTVIFELLRRRRARRLAKENDETAVDPVSRSLPAAGRGARPVARIINKVADNPSPSQ